MLHGKPEIFSGFLHFYPFFSFFQKSIFRAKEKIFFENRNRKGFERKPIRRQNGDPFRKRLHRTELDKPLCDFSERKNGLTDRLSKLQKSLLDGKERTGFKKSPVRSLNSMILSLGIFYSSNSVMSVSVAFPSRMRKVLISYGANWAENVVLKEGRLISAPPEVPLHS